MSSWEATWSKLVLACQRLVNQPHLARTALVGLLFVVVFYTVRRIQQMLRRPNRRGDETGRAPDANAGLRGPNNAGAPIQTGSIPLKDPVRLSSLFLSKTASPSTVCASLINVFIRRSPEHGRFEFLEGVQPLLQRLTETTKLHLIATVSGAEEEK